MTQPDLDEANRLLQRCSGKAVDLLIEYDLPTDSVLTLIVNGQEVILSDGRSVLILADRTITEMFVDDGREAISLRRSSENFDDTTCEIRFAGQGAVTKLVAYAMNSIWK